MIHRAGVCTCAGIAYLLATCCTHACTCVLVCLCSQDRFDEQCARRMCEQVCFFSSPSCRARHAGTHASCQTTCPPSPLAYSRASFCSLQIWMPFFLFSLTLNASSFFVWSCSSLPYPSFFLCFPSLPLILSLFPLPPSPSFLSSLPPSLPPALPSSLPSLPSLPSSCSPCSFADSGIGLAPSCSV
jgi:hypothetical protein